MDQNRNIEMEEVIEEIAEDSAHVRKKGENILLRRTSFRFQADRWPLIFRGMGALFLVALFPLLFGCGDNESSEDLISIKSRLDQVEQRLTLIEGTGQKIARIESRIIKLEQSVENLNRSIAFRTAKMRYHVVRRGDNLSKIAQQYNITVRELSRLNDITPKTVIRPGQKLLVTPGSEP